MDPERPDTEQWWLETQALNISTNYELVVFAMAMFSQHTPDTDEWAPGTFRQLDQQSLMRTCAEEALRQQRWWVERGRRL